MRDEVINYGNGRLSKAISYIQTLKPIGELINNSKIKYKLNNGSFFVLDLTKAEISFSKSLDDKIVNELKNRLID